MDKLEDECPSHLAGNVVPLVPSAATDTRVNDGEQHATDHGDNQNPLAAPADGHLDQNDPIEFVREYIAREDFEVLFDGTVVPTGRPLKAIVRDDIDAVLAVEHLQLGDVVDQMLIECRRDGYGFKVGDINRATRQVLRQKAHQRRNTVIRPLLEPLSPHDQASARGGWDRLSALFEIKGELAIAVLQHLIWQVYQKQLGRPVVHHLMPAVVSPIQGSGKTTFVQKFLGPLRELATGATALTDFADRRSGDIYRFPVVFLDDIEQIDPKLVPILKSLLTAEHIRRRRLSTSMSVGIRQTATLIGTANASIETLIKDDTGHRRFAMLPFRNGNSANGGDPNVWRIVTSSNYERLWRSVDAFGPSPILSCLEELARHQSRSAPKDQLLEWLKGLDMNSEALLRITRRPGVQAQALFHLYLAQTRTSISPQRFSDEMRRHVLDPSVPFGDKFKTDAGTFYRIKNQH